MEEVAPQSPRDCKVVVVEVRVEGTEEAVVVEVEEEGVVVGEVVQAVEEAEVLQEVEEQRAPGH